MIFRVVMAFISAVLGIVMWLTLAMVWGTLVGVVDPIATSMFPDVWQEWKSGPVQTIGNLIDSWYAAVTFIGIAFYLYVSAQKREPMYMYGP